VGNIAVSRYTDRLNTMPFRGLGGSAKEQLYLIVKLITLEKNPEVLT
jgi:hypothetical protein